MKRKLWSYVALASAVFALLPSTVRAETQEPDVTQEISEILSDSGAESGDLALRDVTDISSDTDELAGSGKTDLETVIDTYEEEKSSFLTGGDLSDPVYAAAWNLQKNFQNFIFPSDIRIVSITPKYTVTSVAEEDGKTQVGMDEVVTLAYQDGETVNVSAYSWTFTLTIDDAAQRVTGISDMDSNLTGLRDEGVIITADGINYAEPTDPRPADAASADAEEDDLAGAAASGAVLNVKALVAYADKWAMSYNKAYSNYAGQGGDCANFVSQCLYAGGIPSDSTWYKDSVSWINNVSLREYLSGKGYGYLIEDPDPSQIEAGDLLFYKWKSYSDRTNHVVVCVGKNASGTPIIDSHTARQLHAPWNYGKAAKTYLFKMDNARSTETADEIRSMYRMYNPNSGEHFYTRSSAEKNMLIFAGWRWEGIGWYAPASGDPVYRLYNPNAGDHHYTMDPVERDILVLAGWKYEGVGWYSDAEQSIPLYRQYNPNARSGAHNFTTDLAENDSLVSRGWNAEGIAWYGVEDQ